MEIIENAGHSALEKFFHTNGFRMSYPHKKIIILRGDRIRDVLYVIRGIYKVYSINENGEERTVMLAGNNNILPVSWVLDSMPDRGRGAFYFYEAFTDMVAYRVSAEKFNAMVRENADMAMYLLQMATKSAVELESRLQSLQRSKIEEKTEFILYYLAKRLGHTKDGHIFEIKKPITQQDIADLAGVNRETAARFMMRLYANRVSWKAGPNYYIDIAKLHKKYQAPVYS